MRPNYPPSATPSSEYPHPSTAKRRKYSHPSAGNQPIASREERHPSWDREEYLPFLVYSHPSSSQSSPFQPPTPDHSQSSDRSCSAESLAWPILTRLDEIELLSAIEKHAETYSNELANDELLGEVSPPFRHVDKIHPLRSAPILTARQATRPPINPSFSLLSHQSTPNLQDNKPYKCSLCPKAFTRNYDLTRHKSSHQDQRQHVCAKCGRSFNRRDALIRHTLVKGCGKTTTN